jgi:uncharacterized membrane protein
VTEVPPIIGTYSELKRRGTGLGQIPILVIPATFFCIWIYIGLGNTPLGIFFAALGMIVSVALPIYMFVLRDLLNKAQINKDKA